MRASVQTRAGAWLQAVIWLANTALTAGEILLAGYFPHMLWVVLVADLLLVSPLLLGRQAWYMSMHRAEEDTREYCRPDMRALRRSVFSCLSATYATQWRQAIAWRWGWWWRGVAVAAVSLSPAMTALALSFLTSDSGVLAIGVRLALQVGAGVAALVGVIVAVWWMAGYYPAVYLVAAGEPIGAAFFAARRVMRGYEGCWLGLTVHCAWRFAVGWLPVGGWYALPQAYAVLAVFFGKRYAKMKKV